MEAATHFGQKMLKNPGLSVNDRIQHGYHILLNKPISPTLLQPLVKLYKDSKTYYKSHPELVKEIQVENPNVEDAAFALVANAMLNLDVIITKN
jgi:hypothetical protein